MVSLLVLLVYALIVGCIAKWLHPGPNPVGWLPTIGVGFAGTYIGGFMNWAIGYGSKPIESSGIIMGVLGGVIALVIWRWYKLRYSLDGPRNFWSGKL